MAKSGLVLPAKEFKEAIKSMLSFSNSLGGTFGSAATFTLDPPALRLTSELATLEVLLHAKEVATGGPEHFHFHMDSVAKLALTGTEVEFSWDDLVVLHVSCGLFKADLTIAAATHVSVPWPEVKASLSLPYEVVPEICKYLRLPNSYVDLDDGNTAIELKCDGNEFIASCEDSFSFIRYFVPLPTIFDPVVVPYFTLAAINGKRVSGDVVIGNNGNYCMFNTPGHTLCTSSLNTKLNPWSVAVSSMGKAVISATTDIGNLMDAIKPLFAMIPLKEKSSAIISMVPIDGGLRFDLSQSGSSSATSTLQCPVSGSGTINLHPRALFDFLSMISGLGAIEILAAPVATRITTKTKIGTLEYLITNVIL